MKWNFYIVHIQDGPTGSVLWTCGPDLENGGGPAPKALKWWASGKG